MSWNLVGGCEQSHLCNILGVEPVTIAPTKRFNSSILATIQGFQPSLARGEIPVFQPVQEKKISCKIIADAVSVKSTFLCYMWASFPFEDLIVICREES